MPSLKRVFNKLTHLRVDEVSLVDEPANPGATVALFKRRPTTDGVPTMTIEELTAALEKANADNEALTKSVSELTANLEVQKAANAELTQAVEKAKAGDTESEEDDITKGMTPAAKAAFEKMAAESKANEERIAKFFDEQETERFEKAAGELNDLPVEPAKFGAVLKAASKAMTPEQFAELNRVLKAANAGAADLLKMKGRNTAADPASAEAELNKKAEELRKADPNLTKPQAITKALQQDKSLYERYEQERRDAA